MPRARKSANVVVVAAKPRRRRAPRRRAGVVSGRGYYKGFGKSVGTVVGGALGGVAGGMLTKTPYGVFGGANLGANIGGHIGDMAGRITGRGRYRINYNSIIGNVPSIRNSRGREGATIVRHKEYIGDVLSSTGFNLQYSLPINAAQTSTFPWLAQLAANFEQFEVQGMLFEYVSSSGDTTAGSTSLGEVVMATQYNSYEPPFSTKQQMLNQEFSVSVKPSLNGIHPIECAPKQTTLELLYTRVGAPAPTSDIRLYDLGVFSLATNGQQVDGQNLGELYVTYEIVLMKPKLQSGASLGASGVSHFRLVNPSRNAQAFSGATEVMNDWAVSVSPTQLVFPKGSQGVFKVDMYYNDISGNSISWNQYEFSSASGPGASQYSDAPLLWNDINQSSFPLLGSTGKGPFVYSFVITIPNSLTGQLECNITSTSAIPGEENWNYGHLIITKLNPQTQ